MTTTTTMTVSFDANHLPRPIARKLRSLVRRRRAVVAGRGLLAVTAVALGALLAVMGLDAAIALQAAPVRWALSLAGLGVTLAAGWWFGAKPLARAFTMAGIARWLETHHPEFQERISSAVELTASRAAPELRGSDQLIAELARQATAQVGAVNPRREYSARPIRPFLIATVGAVVVLGALLLIWPAAAGRLLVRAVTPFADVGNVYAVDMTVSPGDVRWPKGESVTIEANLAGASTERADLVIVGPDGARRVERMGREAKEAGVCFSLTVPAVENSFRYRVEAGRAVSRYYSVTVVPRPAVEGLRLHYEYPRYTNVPPQTVEDAPGEILAVAGTRVTVTALLNKPVARAEMRINGKPVEGGQAAGAAAGGERAWTVELTPEMVGTWSLRLTDEDELTNEPVEHRIEALADRRPGVRIIAPAAKQVRMRPTDALPIQYLAEDDYGIAAADMMVSIDAGKAKAVPVRPLAGEVVAAGAWRGDALLKLAELDLSRARKVKVQLRVSDTRPSALGGPQHSRLSNAVTIEIAAKAPGYSVQTVRARETEIAEALREVQARLKQAKRLSTALPRLTGDSRQLPRPAGEKADQLREATAAARQAMQAVTAKLTGSVFEPLRQDAEKIDTEDIAPAGREAERVTLGDSPSERAEHAAEADRKVDEAIQHVQKLADAVQDAAAEARRTLQALDRLADREAKLAAAARAAAASARRSERPQDWDTRQQAVADELKEMVRRDADAQSALRRQQAQQARDLAGQAERLAARQQDLRELTQQARTAAATARDSAKGVHQRIAAQQRQLADEARELADRAGAASPAAKATGQQGAQAAAEAAKQLDADNAGAADRSAEQAARDLSRLGQELTRQNRPSTDPTEARGGQATEPEAAGRQRGRMQTPSSEAAKQTAEAKGLAQRQRKLGEQIKALAEGDVRRAVALMQKDVAGQARELAEQAGRLERTGEALPEQPHRQAPGGAAEAAKQLGEPSGQQDGEKSGGEPSGQQSGGEQRGEKTGGEQSSQQSGGQQPGEQAGGNRGGEKAGGQQGGKSSGVAGTQQEAADAMRRAAEALSKADRQLAGQTDAVDRPAGGAPSGAAAGQSGDSQSGQTGQSGGTPQQAGSGQQDEQSGAGQQGPAGQQGGSSPSTAAGQEAGGGEQGSSGQQGNAGRQGSGGPQAGSGQKSGSGQQSPSGQSGSGNAPRTGGQAGPAPLVDPARLAEALRHAAEAAAIGQASQAAGPASAAAGALARLSQGASQAAAGATPSGAASQTASGQRSGQTSGRGQAPSRGGKSPATGLSSGAVTAEGQIDLDQLGITSDDWIRLSADLKEQIRQAAAESGPVEYRGLIRRYFRELARRGSRVEPEER